MELENKCAGMDQGMYQHGKFNSQPATFKKQQKGEVKQFHTLTMLRAKITGMNKRNAKNEVQKKNQFLKQYQ